MIEHVNNHYSVCILNLTVVNLTTELNSCVISCCILRLNSAEEKFFIDVHF